MSFADKSARKFLEMPLKGIMTTKVIYVREYEPFYRVAENLLSSSIRHLPVINEKGEVTGLLTQRDLYKIVSPHRNEEGDWFYNLETLDDIILKHVMIKNPYTLHPEDTIGQAVRVMVDLKYGCVPIVDSQNILCGIVTQYDILKTIYFYREGK